VPDQGKREGDVKKGLIIFVLFVCLAGLLCGCGGGGGGKANTLSSPLANWHVSATLPAGNSLSDVKYLQGTFVAVGNGVILTSSDGASWTSGTVGTDADNLQGVAYGGGVFIAAGYRRDTLDTIIFSSTDGREWTSLDTGLHYAIQDVTYGNGTFVAVGFGLTQPIAILTSSDGAIWLSGGTEIQGSIRGVTYGNGIFVAVGGQSFMDSAADRSAQYPPANGVTISSPDGLIWTSSRLLYSNVLEKVAHGGGTFVAIGNDINGVGAIFTSTDGIRWAKVETGLSNSILMTGVTYGDNIFVVTGRDGSGSVILSSPDGTTWESISGPAVRIDRIAYGNGAFVGVGYDSSLGLSVVLRSDPVQ
jgi:hypothetical protein